MRINKYRVIRALIITAVFCSVLLPASARVFAAYIPGTGSTGDTSNSGNGLGSGPGSFNCTGNYSVENYCPAWRTLTKQEFYDKWHLSGSAYYDEYAATQCWGAENTEGWVVASTKLLSPGHIANPGSSVLNGGFAPSKYRTFNGLGQTQREAHYKIVSENFRSLIYSGGQGSLNVGDYGSTSEKSLILAFYCKVPAFGIETKPTIGAWSGISKKVASPGETVTFSHAIYKAGNNSALNPDGGYYHINESRNSGAVATGTASLTGGQTADRQFWNSGFYQSGSNYDATLESNYRSIAFTIPSNAKHGDMWCQQITGQSNGALNTGWVTSSQVCVRAQVPPPPTNGGDDPTWDNGKIPPEERNDNINGSATNEDGNAAIVLDVKNNASNTASANKNWTTDGFQFSKITGVGGVTWSQSTSCATYDGDGFCTQWKYNDVVYSPSGGRPAVTTVNVPWQAGTYIWAKPQDPLTFRTLAGKQWTAVHGDSTYHNIYAGYGSCDISGIAGNANCTSTSNPEVSQSYPVPLSVVGTTIKQEAVTNRTYAWQDNFHCHSYTTVDGIQNKCTRTDWQAPSAAGSGNSSASVKVPYNYTTEPKIVATPPIGGPGGGAVFPGERIGVTTTVDIEKKSNTPVSTDDYATQTKPSVYEVITFMATPTSGKPTRYGQTGSATGSTYYTSTPGSGTSCSYYTSASGFAYYSPRSDSKPNCNVEARVTDIYNDGQGAGDDFSLNGRTTNLWGGSVNIDDAPIGTKFCVAVSFWPADSHNGATASTGAENDPSMTTGTGYWQHTPPQCFDIAKKPSLQVWGSSIFSKGSIVTSQSNKKQSDNSYRLFGSWSEYGAISQHPITGLGSGAAFGYELNNGGTFAKTGGLPNGGAASACMYSKATVTNNNCDGGLGSANISDASISITTARLIARYASPTGKTMPSNSLSGLDGKYYVNNNVTINASSIPKGKTIVIYSTGDITINGNIAYNDGPYHDIAELPQVILIAQNIFIAEGVTRVDAWLVAGRQGGGGVIDTCAGYSIGSLSANNCNQKLTINGPLFANKLVTKRTAGAGAGNASIDPGEVFNLRVDSYMWAMAQAQSYRQAVSTNLKNLPPRY